MINLFPSSIAKAEKLWNFRLFLILIQNIVSNRFEKIAQKNICKIIQSFENERDIYDSFSLIGILRQMKSEKISSIF